MRELNLRPFLTSHLGFDSLFDELQRSMTQMQAETPSYPPFNVIKDGEDYVIEVAVAGFKKSDINIELNRRESCLVITSGKISESENEQRSFIKRGLARRSFSLSFKVAQDLEVKDAILEDGILTVILKTVKRPEDAPLLIPIK